MTKGHADIILKRGKELALYGESLIDQELQLLTQVGKLKKEIRDCESKLYNIDEKKKQNEKAIRELLLEKVSR